MPKPSKDIRVTEHRPDKRVKLSNQDKDDIRQAWQEGASQRSLAKAYNVSRRLIQFIIHPDAQERNNLARELRGGWKQYYNPSKHNASIKAYRADQDRFFKKSK